MPKFMDYTISSSPLRIVDLKVDMSKLRIRSLAVTSMGHLPGRTLRRTNVKFDSWALAYIAGGSGHYRVDGGSSQAVGAGSLFFVYPGARFDYGPDPDGHWDEYYVRFEGSRVGEWLGSWLRHAETVRSVGREDDSIGKLETMYALLESGVPAQADRAALLLESLLYDWMSAADDVPAREAAKSSRLSRVIEDLAHNVRQPLDPKPFAAKHHMSVPTLRRLVSQYTGYPLHEYVHRLKMIEAKRMMLNTDCLVKEAADALGYRDVYYFSRLFKKYTGVSPQAYRESGSLTGK